MTHHSRPADAATAEQICEALDTLGWPICTHPKSFWGVEGLDIADTCTYVNSIDTAIDGDYEHWFLVEVCDRDPASPDHYYYTGRTLGELGVVPSDHGEVWVTYLAVYMRGRDAWKAEWHPATNRFFDRVTTPTPTIRHWFIDFAERAHYAPDTTEPADDEEWLPGEQDLNEKMKARLKKTGDDFMELAQAITNPDQPEPA